MAIFLIRYQRGGQIMGISVRSTSALRSAIDIGKIY